LRRHGNVVELRAPGSNSPLDPSYIPFTDPSSSPEWLSRPECYRLLGLDDATRVYDLILESARKLD
jgi:hypothetical protein